MASKPKYYVQVVGDCLACQGTGGPEDDPCPDCKGTGTQEDAVELTAALAALGILTRLEQVEKTAGRAAYYAEGAANGGI